MTDIETVNQHASRFRLALLGAGRLGDAIARVWFLRTGETPLVWSRGGQQPNTERRIVDGAWITNWTEALKAKSIVIAIPGRALIDLAEDCEPARNFEGNIFSAAFSLSRASLQRLFPRATITCISPFLIGDTTSIPMLVLRPPELPILEWEKIKCELHNLGDIDVVQDDELFAHIALLGSSWPVVVLASIHGAASVGLRGLQDETAIAMGRRVFFRAMQSFLSTRSSDGLETESSSDMVATSGGITERGLNNIGEITNLLESVFDQMQSRAHELRA